MSSFHVNSSFLFRSALSSVEGSRLTWKTLLKALRNKNEELTDRKQDVAPALQAVLPYALCVSLVVPFASQWMTG